MAARPSEIFWGPPVKRRSSGYTALSTACFFLMSALSFGQPQARFDEYVRAYVHNGDFSGSVLIARDGRVVFRKSYGMANYELSVPNTEKTRFHIASVSKTFTAAAVLVLEKQGKLKLSDPLSKWLPDYLNGEKITVEQLLTHRSGLPDYYSLPEYPTKKSQRVTLPDLIAWVKTKPLDFLPGSREPLHQYGLCISGVHRGAGVRHAVRGIHCRGTVQAVRDEGVRHLSR